VTDEELEAAIKVLQEQQSLQSSALKAALEARWTGEDSVDAYVKALTPGIVTAPETPLYPDG
jgi:hypothetical protein